MTFVMAIWRQAVAPLEGYNATTQHEPLSCAGFVPGPRSELIGGLSYVPCSLRTERSRPIDTNQSNKTPNHCRHNFRFLGRRYAVVCFVWRVIRYASSPSLAMCLSDFAALEAKGTVAFIASAAIPFINQKRRGFPFFATVRPCRNLFSVSERLGPRPGSRDDYGGRSLAAGDHVTS